MKNRIKKTALYSFLIASAFISCTPDTIDGDGNGLTQGPLDGSFTVSKTAENRYTLKANSDNYLVSRWNIDYEGFNGGDHTQNIFLPDAGTYVVQHQAAGIGGQVGGEAQQTIVVPTSDPVAGNLVRGGRFDTPAEIAEWSIHTISPSGAQWVFANGVATIVASGGNQQAIYQAIQVEAGKKYSIDMVISSKTALVDTWFEVTVLNSMPASGSDISGTVYRAINTWAGCGKSPFGGRISSVGCGDNSGVFTATATGTVYLVIKCGGTTVNGLSVDKVEFRRTE